MESESQLQPPPENLLNPLLELQNYYAPLVEKYEKLYTQALDNLNHVEALISNWSTNSSANGNLPTLEVTREVLPAPIEENRLLGNSASINETSVNLVEPTDSELTQTNGLEVEELSQSIPNIEMPSVVDEVVSAALDEDLLSSNSDNITESSTSLVEPSNSVVEQTDVEIGEEDELLASTSTILETSSATPEISNKSADIPMLAEYQSLNRPEAIQKVLQKHAGTVCHIDFIVRSLYGELEPDVFKVVKSRVQSTLTYGRESGKWFLIPGKPGCFTLDLKLLNSNRAQSSPKQSKTKNNKPDRRGRGAGGREQGEQEKVPKP
ncbi:MAG: hypothetical protein KME32_33820 [Mojavia pulchra JT2-VF2]|jgi:hypothetical protein|uniref:Uncharacterized protein n=1 Tax=Mojavia pulchra JT2-VF2 TaxID=287848 RepID=A0A951Q7G6_9NOST|nr:hypothetical protein [Mojavia pulchra JT2-VF2]